ncbi:MAG: flagellar hook-basal body complex protein, partial [bacterium]
MMGSMFSSISGLKNHTTWMNTIGNNISNVNTVAYKSQRVTFKEQVSQSLGSASAASTAGNIGGKNPLQQGLGAALGSIDTIMTQGAIQTTGNPLDVAITGEGFFTVASGSRTMYTRAGNFLQDNVGNVTTSDGGIVQGWMGNLERTFLDDPARNPGFQIDSATYTIDTDDVSQIGNVNIPSDLRMSAQATRFVKFSGNLDSNTPINNYATNVPAAAPTALPSNFSPNSAPSQLGGAASVNLEDVQDGDAGTNYYFHTDPADENSSKVAPDHTATFTVYDSLGNPRDLTVWFFQHGTDPTGGGNDYRPVWDWYAFDTTYDPRFDNLTGEPDYFNCV